MTTSPYNQQLIQALLRALEARGGSASSQPKIEGWDAATVAVHVERLIKEGLIDARQEPYIGGHTEWVDLLLTPEGYAALESDRTG